MVLLHATRIAVWFKDDVPAMLWHGGDRYTVTDVPTHLEDELAFMMHPLDLVGWRFQATRDDGLSMVFDIRRQGDDWLLVRAWD